MLRKKLPLKNEQETCRKLFAIYKFYNIYGKQKTNNLIKMGYRYKKEFRKKEIQVALKHVTSTELTHTRKKCK